MNDAGQASYTLAEAPPQVVRTVAASDETLISSSQDSENHRGEWQAVIDRKLIEWGRNPALLAEREMIAPTAAAIGRAVAIAQDARDRNLASAFRVAPDGDGGIVFERWDGQLTESIEIDRDGRVEYVVCRDRAIVKRIAIPR